MHRAATRIGGDMGRPGTVELRYLSGTGNTWRVAGWFAEAAEGCGASVRLLPIRRLPSAAEASSTEPGEPGARRLIGLLTPTHGFTAPWGAVREALRAPGLRGADVFVVATRAGWYAGPWRLPGFEGTASWLIAAILAARGGRVVGITGIDMPSNWTALHWGMNDAHAGEIVAHAATRTRAFAREILDGRRRFRGWIPLAGGIALAPVSLGYLLVAHFVLGKLFFADERCTACRVCVTSCPFDALAMRGPAPGRPYWSFRCESCMRCMNVCPERAIQVSWPLAAGFAFLWSVPVGALAVVALALTGVLAPLLDNAVQYAWVIGTAAACYAVLWTLSLLRPVAWLIGHTTLTRVFRRYREPGSDLRRI